MVRKLQNFQVQFDGNREVFFSGEQLTGIVIVDTSQEIKCKKIQVKLTGVSYCSWTTTRTERDSQGNTRTITDHHSGCQSLVEQNMIVFGSTTRQSVKHPSGRHVYTFAFNLPSSLPSSFEGGTGHIRYLVEGKVDRPWKFDHTIRKPFTVMEVIDVNLPQYTIAQSGEKQKQIGCLCCIAGNLNMQASIDRSGYCPGELIHLTASCDNDSTRKMDCMRATLIQHITYHASDGSTTGCSKKIARYEGEKIPKKGQDSWNNQPFLIPPLPPTINTHPVSVCYEFKFQISVPWGFDPKISFNVTMGTVPFRQSYGSQPSYQLAENQFMEDEFANWVPPTAPALPSTPPPTVFGYPDMPPPSYAAAVGGLPVDVRDTNAKSNFGDQSYMPMYTYAQQFQGPSQAAYPPTPTAFNLPYPPPSGEAMSSVYPPAGVLSPSGYPQPTAPPKT